MTDHRLPRDSYLGHAGRLSTRPLELVVKAEDCGWQSSRDFAENGLSIKRLSVGAPGEPQAILTTSEHRSNWQISKREEAWLLRNHPEARFGDSETTHRFLSDARNRDNDAAQERHHRSLLAVGEMLDGSEAKSQVVPLIVNAVGDGNVIRFTRASYEKWQSPADERIFALPLSEKKSIVRDYSEVIGQIRSLKCVVDPKPFDTFRALMAQWDTQTRLFLPEVSKASVPSDFNNSVVVSTIVPNCVLSLARKDTGGGDHCDVAFNPGTTSASPQLAIIDDQGFFSVWDIPGLRARTNRRLRANRVRCGSLENGVLERLPRVPISDSGWHSIHWVGPADESINGLDDSDYEDSNNKPPPLFSSLPRSSSLLICSSKSARLLDLNNDFFLEELPLTSSDPYDNICEVRVQPDDSSCIFIATNKTLYVLRVTSTIGLDFTKPMKKWFIVTSISHFRSVINRSLRFSVSEGPKQDGKRASLLLLYSAGSQFMDLVHIVADKHDPLQIKWRRDTLKGHVDVQEAWLQLVAIDSKASSSPSNRNRDLTTAQIRCYQLFQKQRTGDVSTTLYMISTGLSSDNTLSGLVKLGVEPKWGRDVSRPGSPGFVKVESRRRHWKSQTGAIKRVANRLVIPDDQVWDHNAAVLAPQPFGYLSASPLSRFLGPFIVQFVKSAGWQTSVPEWSDPFEPAHKAIEEAADVAQFPASTILELIGEFQLPRDLSESNDIWDTEIELMKRSDSRLDMLAVRRPDSTLGNITLLHDIVLYLQELFGIATHTDGENEWVDPDQFDVLCKMACDLHLSSTGVFFKTPDVGTSGNSAVRPWSSVADAYLRSSQTSNDDELPSSQVTNNELPSAGNPVLSQESSTSNNESPAMQLIRSYTGSGAFIPKKITELENLWEAGANPYDYVFDMDKEKEVTEGMKRTERKLAKASRKRQRAETLLRFQQRSQIDDVPSTQPVPETSFIQSSPVRHRSSQNVSQGFSQPFPMSQPVAGPFAQRPKKKAKQAKRKGGF